MTLASMFSVLGEGGIPAGREELAPVVKGAFK